MYRMYNTDLKTNITEETREFKKGNWISMISPSESEIKEVCEKLKIQPDFIRYALDFEEKARIDFEEDDDTTLFLIDVPIIEKVRHSSKKNKKKNTSKAPETDEYTTMPLGLLLVRDEYFITVSLKKNKIIDDIEKIKKGMYTYKKSRMIFQIFYKNASEYLRYLKQINKETQVAESVLKTSLQNKELLKMLSLEKSLVYFTTSLKSNELVMEKTLRGKILKLYDEDEDILEDAIIENKQAIEMAKIYSDILNGTMDAYASIISNNLNGVMKFLTAITIIIAMPTLISSYWGMNVRVPFQDNPYGFLIVFIISIILGLTALFWLKKKNMVD